MNTCTLHVAGSDASTNDMLPPVRPDELARLGDEIAELSAHLTAATPKSGS